MRYNLLLPLPLCQVIGNIQTKIPPRNCPMCWNAGKLLGIAIGITGMSWDRNYLVILGNNPLSLRWRNVKCSLYIDTVLKTESQNTVLIMMLMKMGADIEALPTLTQGHCPVYITGNNPGIIGNTVFIMRKVRILMQMPDKCPFQCSNLSACSIHGHTLWP